MSSSSSSSGGGGSAAIASRDGCSLFRFLHAHTSVHAIRHPPLNHQQH